MNFEDYMLDFLMENDVTIFSEDTKRQLRADSFYIIPQGEFVVYDPSSLEELYRGNSFDDAMKVLYGKELGE